MKRLTEFLHCVLLDLERWCCTSTTHDFNTVVRRIENEGLSFLTITLSDFGKDFERSLDQKQVSPQAFPGFKRKAGLPLFLRGFLEQIFDSSGCLINEPSITAIWAVRQFTLMFAKINIECATKRTQAAIRRYVECDQEVREHHERFWEVSTNEMVSSYRRLGTMLWSDSLVCLERKVLAVPSEIIPKHGPGATSESLVGNAKWIQSEWTDRLDQVFPSGEHLVSSWKFRKELARVRFLEPGAERPTRVITVPKSLKTPRIIAIEPTCMQYVQQGLLAGLRASLQQDRLCWDFIGWGTQVPNQHLASQGSRGKSLATLDLSEASDRVSWQHVTNLLWNHPSLREAVDSCRSRTAAVPGFGEITLAKFASMGSALCFPFESMVFLTIIFQGIEKQRGRPLTRFDLLSFRGKVRVYGDDIIVPVEYVRSVIDSLEAHGLKVNSGKSFWNGSFRESCGKEYYDGEDVSIVRLRSLFPSSLRDGTEIISSISTRNQLYKAGLWGSARYLDNYVSKVIKCPLPRVSEDSPVLGRHSFLGPDLSGKLHHDTHQPLVRGPIVSGKIPSSPLENYGALLKCLTRLELASTTSDSDVDEPYTANIWNLQTPDVKHLDRSGRPRFVDIKIGMGPSA